MANGFRSLLENWTPTELREILDVPYTTAASLRDRGRLPARYWRRLIKAAPQKGLTITADMLARLAEERKTRDGGADEVARNG